MEVREKSYSEWQDEAAHLNKEQWNLARDLLSRGESSNNAILMAENLILPGTRKEYLKSKPSLYQFGWLNAETSDMRDVINVPVKDQKLFEQGYEDCKNNIERLNNLKEVA
tara:strand:- start:526 stop:858 length:333 start_codon:yes stop_codon:yes gene_type:complete